MPVGAEQQIYRTLIKAVVSAKSFLAVCVY